MATLSTITGPLVARRRGLIGYRPPFLTVESNTVQILDFHAQPIEEKVAAFAYLNKVLDEFHQIESDDPEFVEFIQIIAIGRGAGTKLPKQMRSSKHFHPRGSDLGEQACLRHLEKIIEVAAELGLTIEATAHSNENSRYFIITNSAGRSAKLRISDRQADSFADFRIHAWEPVEPLLEKMGVFGRSS